MKKLFATILLAALVVPSIFGGIKETGWTSTTDPATARTALGVSTNLNTSVILISRTLGEVSYGTNFQAFSNAVSAALPGDTVRVGIGTFNGYGILYKPVNLKGISEGIWDREKACFVGGSTITNDNGYRFGFDVGYSNSFVENLSVEGGTTVNGAVCNWGPYVTNVFNQRLKNVSFGHVKNFLGVHLVEITGANIDIDGLSVYSANTNGVAEGTYGIIFKGCSNVVARNLYCYNAAINNSALLIKSQGQELGSGGSKGGVWNIDINGVEIDLNDNVSSTAQPIFISTSSDNSTMRDVTIKNVRVRGPNATQAAILIGMSGVYTNCTWDNVDISGINIQTSNNFVFRASGQDLTNTVLHDISLSSPIASGPSAWAAPYPTNSYIVFNNLSVNNTNYSGTNWAWYNGFGGTVVPPARNNFSGSVSMDMLYAPYVLTNTYGVWIYRDGTNVYYGTDFNVAAALLQAGDFMQLGPGRYTNSLAKSFNFRFTLRGSGPGSFLKSPYYENTLTNGTIIEGSTTASTYFTGPDILIENLAFQQLGGATIVCSGPNIQMRNVTIASDGTNTSGIVFTIQNTNFYGENIKVYNGKNGYGLAVYNATNVLVDGMVIDGCNHPIYVSGLGTATNITLRRITTQNSIGASWFRTGNNYYLQQLTLRDCLFDNRPVFWTDNSTAGGISGVLVENLYVSVDNTFAEFYAPGGTLWMTNVNFVGCYNRAGAFLFDTTGGDLTQISALNCIVAGRVVNVSGTNTTYTLTSAGVVFPVASLIPTNVFQSVSNQITVDNSYYVLQASGNGALTNIIPKYQWATLWVSNSSAITNTFSITAACRLQRPDSTNLLYIEPGKVACISIASFGTNVCTSNQQ